MISQKMKPSVNQVVSLGYRGFQYKGGLIMISYNDQFTAPLIALHTPAAFCGDCLDILPRLPPHSIDMILCDLPYHITRNAWDTPIPLEDYIVVGEHIVPFSELKRLLWEPRKRQWVREHSEFCCLLAQPMRDIVQFWSEHKRPGLWSHYKRIIKSHGVIVLFGSGMFSAELMATGRDLWRYNIIWEKNHPTGFLNANRMPLRCHEDILVFYRKLPVYHPQKSTDHPRKVSTAQHKRNSKKTTNYGAYKLSSYDSTERFPTSIWKFPSDKEVSSIHPTQKPVALCEALIKTYTDEGALVLDNCAGSFTTAVACDNLNRNWIAIEKDNTYFYAGLERVNKSRETKDLPEVEFIQL